MSGNEASTDGWTLIILLGLGAVTVISRCFFYLSNRPLPLPQWVHRSLQYAPIAALGAVVGPELVLTGGQLSLSLGDARLWAGLAAVAFVLWRRNTNYTLPGAIVVGMGVYLPLHMGWLPFAG